jgi:uncharacterized protein YcgI (DUF1989 family)
VIPPRSGRAWELPDGHVCRLSPFDGPQVQVTGLRGDDERYFLKPCPASSGDHFEVFAEIDRLMAASTCPGGDLSVPPWGADAAGCRPMRVDVFALEEDLLFQWRTPGPVNYRVASGVRTVTASRPASVINHRDTSQRS